MTDRLYPISLAELEHWRIAHDTTLDEARKRFMQFVVLQCIADSPAARQLTLKGGNALRFVYRSPRGTIDLDFTATADFPDSKEAVRDLLNGVLRRANMRFGVKAKCQRVRRNPPGEDKTTPTYEIRVGFQLPGDRHYHDYEVSDRNVSTVVSVEISLNDVVCETRAQRLDPGYDAEIRVCVSEDILAEKLRALLQQPIRGRHRKQDVFDVARIVRSEGSAINRQKVADYLCQKARARGIHVRKSSFDDTVRRYAAFEYETLFSETDPHFIPFDEAWETVKALVAQLDLPD